MGDAARNLMTDSPRTTSGHGVSAHGVSGHGVSEHSVVSIDLTPSPDRSRVLKAKIRSGMRLSLAIMFVGVLGFSGGILVSIALLSGQLEIDKQQVASMLRSGAEALKLIDSK